jgi:hypothetical protein
MHGNPKHWLLGRWYPRWLKFHKWKKTKDPRHHELYIPEGDYSQSLIVQYRRTVNSFFTVPVIIIPKWISVIICYDEVSHKLLAVIGWSYLFSLGRHTCICICFLSTIRCVTFFSNKWIISIFCERQISIK